MLNFVRSNNATKQGSHKMTKKAEKTAKRNEAQNKAKREEKPVAVAEPEAKLVETPVETPEVDALSPDAIKAKREEYGKIVRPEIRPFDSTRAGQDAQHTFFVVSHIVHNLKRETFGTARFYKELREQTNADLLGIHTAGNVVHASLYRISKGDTMRDTKKDGSVVDTYAMGGIFLGRDGKISKNAGVYVALYPPDDPIWAETTPEQLKISCEYLVGRIKK